METIPTVFIKLSWKTGVLLQCMGKRPRNKKNRKENNFQWTMKQLKKKNRTKQKSRTTVNQINHTMRFVSASRHPMKSREIASHKLHARFVMTSPAGWPAALTQMSAKFCRRTRQPAFLFFSVIIAVVIIQKALKGRKAPEKHRFHRSALVNDSLNLEVLVPAVSPKHRSGDTFLLVIVNSAANGRAHLDKRNAIRETWGKNPRPLSSASGWSLVFIVGKTHDAVKDGIIQEESEKFGDLLVVDNYDTYREITKKLLSSFNWASEKRYRYVLKTDDDVYVKLPALIEWLTATQQVGGRFYGGVVYHGQVVRDKEHRHYVSEQQLSLSRYPAFCKGSLYVLSWDLLPKMISLSRKVTRITADDAYVGLLANALFVEPVSMDRFIQLDFLDFFIEILTDCQLSTMIGFSDSLSPRHIYYLHERVSQIRRQHSFCIHVGRFVVLLSVVCVCLVFWYAVQTSMSP